MSAAYLFMLAAIIASFSILVVFKIFIDKLKVNPENRVKLQTNFFIGVAIAETSPILLLVLAFANSATVTSNEELYIPGLITLLTLAFASFFIFLQTKVDVTEEAKEIVKTSAIIGLALVVSIPFISLIGLFTLMPS